MLASDLSVRFKASRGTVAMLPESVRIGTTQYLHLGSVEAAQRPPKRSVSTRKQLLVRLRKKETKHPPLACFLRLECCMEREVHT